MKRNRQTQLNKTRLGIQGAAGTQLIDNRWAPFPIGQRQTVTQNLGGKGKNYFIVFHIMMATTKILMPTPH